MAVSLKTIAEELNVSVSLVSKVLSGRMSTSGASEPMVKAIRKKAKDMGYQRNRVATALVTGRTGVLGVFVHRLGAEGSGVIEDLVRGISAAASAEHQRLWLTFFHTDEDFRNEKSYLHNGEIDGLIVAGVTHPELMGELRELQTRGLPVVTIYDQPYHPDLLNIGVDQAQIIRLATDHLLERGVKKPAHIIASEARAKGFRQSLEAHGMPLDPQRIYTQVEMGYEYDVGEKAVEHWLAHNVAFDGIVAQSDQQALGALHALMRHNIRVPEQVRLIGVDNSPVGKYALVPLSSVSEHYEQRGVKAVELLMQRIETKQGKSTSVAPTLIARRSSE